MRTLQRIHKLTQNYENTRGKIRGKYDCTRTNRKGAQRRKGTLGQETKGESIELEQTSNSYSILGAFLRFDRGAHRAGTREKPKPSRTHSINIQNYMAICGSNKYSGTSSWCAICLGSILSPHILK